MRLESFQCSCVSESTKIGVIDELPFFFRIVSNQIRTWNHVRLNSNICRTIIKQLLPLSTAMVFFKAENYTPYSI